VPVDRPTFSESWYRVSELAPRLRSTVQVHRQHYRGQMWHVLQDPSSNQYFRLNEAAYRFVALLDGRRSVAQVWRLCSDQLGDSAPTQGEAIQLLGQLYTSNLLHADLPPDAQGLFKRYQKRVRREVQGYLMNLLFIRIPLIDPDNFLNAWVGAISWLFTWFGFALWLGLIGTGLYFVIENWADLFKRAENVLDVENLPFLYLSFVLIKVCHEFGHAFMCKTFGRRTGTGGEVHVMGIMFLVFTPMPYMDASSAWAFRSRRQRIIVSCGGMIIELALAAIAAIVWARVGEGSLRTICYNAMFIASVSTILFNANPLLRYDGYYILSDILEIPNLAQRSKQYIYYLVKKYVWNVRQARNPAHTRGEKGWFIFYGIASTLYRVFICVRILLFVASKLFMLGVILATAAAVTWVLVPLGKFFRYLVTSGELIRVRPRAMATTALVLGLIVGGLGFVPAPDRFRLDGVVEPDRLQIVHAATDGFVTGTLSSGRAVTRDGEPLLTAESSELAAQHEELLAERRQLVAQRMLAQTQDVAAAQILAERIATLDERIDRVRQRRDDLVIRAGLDGEWIAPKIERVQGAYLRRGDKIGLVASRQVIIRATAGQEVADMLLGRPTDLYELHLPAEAAADLQAAMRAGAPPQRELTGQLVLASRPDEPIGFVVQRIEAEEAGPGGSAADANADPNAGAGRGASAAAGAPLGPLPAADSNTGVSDGPAGGETLCTVHIRLKKVPRDHQAVEDLAVVRINGREYGKVLTRRKVPWRGIEIRIKGLPDPPMTGRIRQIIEAGHEQLPSAALGYAAGGSIRTDPKDPRGRKAAERFFEIRIVPDPVDDSGGAWHGRCPLLSGQRVVVRVEMPSRPLARQWYRSILQLIQRRFQI
jgi:putative peptide zinc metalloprotease protein